MTALKAYALTTLARYKTYAKIKKADSDDTITNLINQVTEIIEKYCGRRFKKTAYTQELLDSDGGNCLFPKNSPIFATPAPVLQERQTYSNKDEWGTVDTDDYYIDYDTGIIYGLNNCRWIEGRQQYRLTYTAGYDFDNASTYLSDTEAGSVEYAAWKLIDEMMSKRGQAQITHEQLGDYTVDYGRLTKELPSDITEILDCYKIGGDLGGAASLIY